MPKNVASDAQFGRIRVLLVGSKLGIVDIRRDITETEAQELIKQLEDEARELIPVEDLDPWQRPTPPQNQMVKALMSLKQDPWTAVQQTRRNWNIPEGQMLTSTQMEYLIARLRTLPTLPGCEEDVSRLHETVLQKFGWADRVM